MSATQPNAFGILLSGLVALASSVGAGPTDIVRVRAPASKVDAWFPKGSELISLPIAEFEALVAKALRGLGGVS